MRALARVLIGAALAGLLVVCLRLIALAPAAPDDHWLATRAAHYGLRAGLVVVALGAWFWTQSLIGSRGLEGEAIGDGLHRLSAPLHAWLSARPRVTNAVLIVSSFFIDLFGLFLIGTALFGSTLRPFVGLLLVFAFRQACQGLCALPVPRGMLWRNPGFPSLLVTYGVGNDFFISGHTAVAVLGAIEIARMGPAWLAVAAGLVAALEAFTVIVLRAHWTMDVLGAVCAAGCAAVTAAWLCG